MRRLSLKEILKAIMKEQNPFKTYSRDIKNPGGDGAGGFAGSRVSQDTGGNQSSSGHSYSASGYKGWSSSPAGKEFDLPGQEEKETEEENVEKRRKFGVDGYPESLMDDPPVGYGEPLFIGGRNPPMRYGNTPKKKGGVVLP